MKPHTPKSLFKIAGRAFTLVELLVSMAILSIMLLSLASAMSFISQLFISSIGSVDNFGKARVVLNALDRDIQMMVMRRDMAAFSSPVNVPVCAFYTQVQGAPVSSSGTGLTSPDTRTVSLVQYSLSQLPTAGTATNSFLQRVSYGMNFTNSTMAVSPVMGYSTNLVQLGSNYYAAPGFNTPPAPENISNGVVAFQWQFIDGTGTVFSPTASLPFNFNYVTPGSPTNYRTVVISMAVLSNSAYKLAIQTGNLTKFTDGVSVFSTSAPTANQTYSQVWNNILKNPNTTFLQLPAPIRSGVQVYERHIPLPQTTPTS